MHPSRLPSGGHKRRKGSLVKIAMVGLGKMGGNMTRRLLRAGHAVVAHARTSEAVAAAVADGAIGASSLEEVVRALEPPRAVWLMVPAGGATEGVVNELAGLLDSGDVVVDGGNSRYTDSIRRAGQLSSRGIGFIDCGTSGGIWGLTEGYCLMVGGDPAYVRLLEPAFSALAPDHGYAHVGPPGAGHFVKMVHNGVEYALMEAYGEGFEILKSSDFGLDLSQIAEVWRHGSVVRSWLLDLAAHALENDPNLERVAGYVEDSGEGRWTVEAAIDAAVPAPAITLSLFRRFASRQDESFSNKMLAALRKEFGGHAVRDAPK
jgi:6-phosphogluconate dehydrogenase